MIDILINEEEFIEGLELLSEWAEENDLDSGLDSETLIYTMTAYALSQSPDVGQMASLFKLIYNLGYRDNHFKPTNIH